MVKSNRPSLSGAALDPELAQWLQWASDMLDNLYAGQTEINEKIKASQIWQTSKEQREAYNRGRAEMVKDQIIGIGKGMGIVTAVFGIVKVVGWL